ncbi:hypothetical protein RHSIM_Rhsim01G0051900 [Rhododendron simsii]|uniref:Uncharacterized protein n=1 Tax=Rhododendron simsii TaxID=118357 RepID=A0A834HT30_RHOSS|nr:hypothetical protein RHSIM_Rhsim01G0051900 [Rhododendron simsii]
MRPYFLLSVLLLSTIISEVQAIRLKKEFLSVTDHKIQVGFLSKISFCIIFNGMEIFLVDQNKKKLQEGRTVNKASDGAINGEDILCKEGQCSSGKNRKLIAKATSTNPTTISKNETNGGKSSTDELGGKHQSFSVDSSPDSNHREATPERYPDTLNIDEMDYSPARRKPPIHN